MTASGSHPSILARLARAALLTLVVLILGGICLFFYYTALCLDGCGPYHNRTSLADLDGDGDLDVILSGLRHESDTTVWAGATLWINQGKGNFTPQAGPFGGPYTTAGDVNGDGELDLLRWAYNVISIHLNYGETDPAFGNFQVWYGVHTQSDPINWGVTVNGYLALGDLNGDGRLDAFVGKCCGTIINPEDDFLPYLPWVWINLPDENGYPRSPGVSLTSIGDLPMQPALGDLDNDGDLDVYAASLPPKAGDYDPRDRILLNDGSGAFADTGQRLENPRRAGNAASGAVALGDLDADGDLDALVATAKGAALWLNQGGAQAGQTGVFAASGQRLGGGHTEAVFLADFDADGDLDALVEEKALATVWLDAVIANGKAQATIWWNDGQGGFRDSGQRLKFTERDGLAVGDFNGDAYPDLFSATNVDYRLWLNRGNGRLQAQN